MTTIAEKAATKILKRWDAWDGEAQQAAQVAQDDRAYELCMIGRIAAVVDEAIRESKFQDVMGKTQEWFASRSEVQ